LEGESFTEGGQSAVLGERRHTRRVKWVRPDVPRDEFHQDLLYSLGAFMTVCQITRNDAEARVAAILEGKQDPGSPPGRADDGGRPPRTDLDVML
jgi:restriction system protein